MQNYTSTPRLCLNCDQIRPSHNPVIDCTLCVDCFEKFCNSTCYQCSNHYTESKYAEDLELAIGLNRSLSLLDSDKTQPKTIHNIKTLVDLFDAIPGSEYIKVAQNGRCFFTACLRGLGFNPKYLYKQNGVLFASDKGVNKIKKEILSILQEWLSSNSTEDTNELRSFLDSVGATNFAHYRKMLSDPHYHGGTSEFRVLLRNNLTVAGMFITTGNSRKSFIPFSIEVLPETHTKKLLVLVNSGDHFDLIENPFNPKGVYDIDRDFLFQNCNEIYEDLYMDNCVKNRHK